ncbi:MAG: metallophosphoesterase [Prevotellaceae bacterium]|jgi:hypothetical protein|nr:metallophosphoesterase [Prevotellaceae bacterium]
MIHTTSHTTSRIQLAFVLLAVCASVLFTGCKESHLSADGPYVLYSTTGTTANIIQVNKQGDISSETVDLTTLKNREFHVTDHHGDFPFTVKLHAVTRPAWNYHLADKTFVMSDPHGRLDCVVSLLQGNGVIDRDLHWSFGANHLMVIGDVFDRGKDVIQIFWLLYKLEAEAEAAGGRLSFLLGNHEPMVLGGRMRYAEEKYEELAHELNMDYRDLVGPNSELGRWLATRNTIEVSDSLLFVHAGLGAAFYDRNLDPDTVNQEISRALFMTGKERRARSPLTKFLYGGDGPIWYRGMVRDDAKYYPLSTDTLNLLLKRYHVERIIVGHTTFDDVSEFYNGRVIGVNVDNRKNMKEKLGRALLIENNQYIVVSDNGALRPIE